MTRNLLALAALACAVAAAPHALAQPIPAADLPPAVVASVRAAMPQTTLTQAVRKEREGRGARSACDKPGQDHAIHLHPDASASAGVPCPASWK